MKVDLEPWDEDIAKIIASGRVEEEPTDAVKEHARARMELAIESEVGSVPSAPSETTTQKSGVVWFRRASVRRIAYPIIALAAGIAIGFFARARRPHPTVPNQTVAHSSPPPRTYVPPSDRPATLGAFASNDEGLLDDATKALMNDDPHAAIDKLDEHARKHPQGPLTELREALYVEALARSGQGAIARERGDRFFATYPKSLLGPAVKDALARISDE